MTIIAGRQSAHPEQDFALFLIGMRFNNFLAVHRWWPVVTAMTRMQAELARKPEAGLLSQRSFLSGRVIMVVQYWRSTEKLFAFAQDRDGEHFPAWTAFNRALKDNAAVGIWHETYSVTPDMAENIYTNMPAFGLGAAIGVAPARARMNPEKKT